MIYMAAVPRDQPTIPYEALAAELKDATTDSELFRAIVNAPYMHPLETAYLFLGIIVLLQVNTETGTIDRIALSDTELAKNTTNVSVVPFNSIKIPLDYPENIISMAIKSNEPRDTIDWKFLFQPALTAQQARINQASGGIAYSAVYPLSSRNGGAMIFSYYQYQGQIGEAQQDFMVRYSAVVNSVLAKSSI
jgi:hypothetical protein